MHIQINTVTWYSIAFFFLTLFVTCLIGFLLGRSFAMTHTSLLLNMHCGGFVLHPAQCPHGYMCQLGKIPDAGGTCVKQL